MSDYAHNLIQCLAVAHIVLAGILGFSTFLGWAESDPLIPRPAQLAGFVLIGLIPVTAAWLATYGGIR